ncbi:protogenin B-like isoform X2 [Leptidea sinapis]|uniref:protogenin B-like isoform X2 n=1 Tax=Leptidea sinapis TaxID=189913 RepID=UPI0021295BFB|nr:protogenin B-like isoform X2 [Leptidea sinapis]
MALILLQVLVLGVIAAAGDRTDIPVTWSNNPRAATLPCELPDAAKVQPRRPPPPLDDERPRPKPYFWRKGDQQINPKRTSTNGTLEVSRKTGAGAAGSEGVYECGVRHHSGLVLGYPINLKFPFVEKQFTEYPKEVKARIGQPLAIPCSIGSGPPASITWLKDGEALPQNYRYHILNQELLITDVKREDAGSYRCTVSNTYLNKNKTSPEGVVQVKKSTDTELSWLPVHNDTLVVKPRGSKVVLACPVLGWPRPKLIWELTTPGGRPAELESSDEVLVLPNLQHDQQGMYSCYVEGRSDIVKSFNVSVSEPVSITLPPVSKQAMRASTVRFNCTAEGSPEPRITWYKDGQPLPLAGRINVRTSVDRTRNELVIGGVTSDDAGVYQCFASNGHSVSSSWAELDVTGAGAAAPGAVQCAPTGPSSVALWWSPAAERVVAYTVNTTPGDKTGIAITGQPHNNTSEIVKVKEALTPYYFQVRAYIPSTSKNIASDMSESVMCQGQGVPIKLIKLEDDEILVTWKQFAEENPGVVEWVLQYTDGSDTERHTNVTLPEDVYNYTLTVQPTQPVFVRVLGSRSHEWLHQNLSLVAWTSSELARQDPDGEVNVVPYNVEVGAVRARGFDVRWQCDDAARYTFLVCVRGLHTDELCQESYKNSASIGGLQPARDYEVRVQVRVPGRALGGAFSPPYRVTTTSEGLQRFKELTYKFVNSSTVRVSWKAPSEATDTDSSEPSEGSEVNEFTVRYSSRLKLPVEMWAAKHTKTRSVLISGIEPTEPTFVMVMGFDPISYSPILTIPPQRKELELKDLKYEYTSSGVRVWRDEAVVGGVVRYAQNITQPLDTWTMVESNTTDIEINNINMALPLYVMVTGGGGTRARSHVLTVAPRAGDTTGFYLGIGLGVAFCLASVVAAVALYLFWRKRKRNMNRTPSRSRRAAREQGEDEGSELKSKTPNGNVRGRCDRSYDVFDLSRHEPDTTLETELDDTISFALLDTSRRPDIEPRPRSANTSFTKLPDDNMNSELNRSDFELDNSKIQPTLQPNG